MDFCSDGTTFVDSGSPKTMPQPPKSDYLWISSHGTALPGWHHQLICHLLALDDSWKSGLYLDFQVIKHRVRDYCPGYLVSNSVLAEIAEEYKALGQPEGTMYRMTNAFTVTQTTNSRLEKGRFSTQTNPVSFDPLGSESSDCCHIQTTNIPKLVPDRISFKPATCCLPNMSSTVENSSSKPNSAPKVFASNVQGRQSLDGVEVTEENAKVYAPLFLDALVARTKPQCSSAELQMHTTGRRPNSWCDKLADGLVKAPDLPLPDPTKYIETSKKHWRIPSSEAHKFVVHFNPEIDPVPEKIEGYFWYCDECYAQGQNDIQKRGKRHMVKGKFSSKRSVEKHFSDIHKEPWKCNVLPEQERNHCMTSGQAVLVNMNTDRHKQKFNWGIGTVANGASKPVSTLSHDFSKDEKPREKVHVWLFSESIEKKNVVMQGGKKASFERE